MIVDAIVHPAELLHLASRGVGEAVCVVFDVLRATSTMVTALQHGVTEIIPAVSIEGALALRNTWPQALLGGERHGEPIEGFDLGNSPLEYINLCGAQIITTTTNGTVALNACSSASMLLVGAVLNLDALIGLVRSLAPRRLIAVCSGTGEGAALEDTWAAGALVEAFEREECTDSALLALAVRRNYPSAGDALRLSQNGKVLQRKGKVSDVEWCEKRSVCDAIGVMREGVIRRWKRDF